MNEFMKNAKAFLVGIGVGIGAILTIVITVLARQGRSAKTSSSSESLGETRKEALQNEFASIAESKRQKAEDSVRATPARDVAERYEGVGNAIDDGKNRFATRVKNRILEGGGRRIDGQRTD